MTDLAFEATLRRRPSHSGGRPGARSEASAPRERISSAVGLASTLIGLVALRSARVSILRTRGSRRLSWDFFTTFPSRRASAAGILSAWVGSVLVILVTALVAVPLGVGAGIYLEEYARQELDHQHHRDQRHAISRPSPRSSTACWRSACSSTVSGRDAASSQRA